MKPALSNILRLAALASIFSTGVQAAVVYDFTAESSFSAFTGSFTYTAPGFVTTNITVPAASLDSCVINPAGDSCGDQQFVPDTSSLEGGTDLHDAIGFTDETVLTTAYYYFPDGSFGTPGVYDTVLFGTEQAGHLVIRVVGEIGEPATLALLGVAIASLGFAGRRKPS